MNIRSRRARKIGLYLVWLLGLAVVFLMYFRPGLVLDVANFIWRCA